MQTQLSPLRTYDSFYKNRSLPSRARGFIQGVILFGIALLAIVVAAFAFSNKSGSVATTAEEDKMLASSIISHGNTLRSAADRFRTDRGSLDVMTFSTTDANGLFFPSHDFIKSLSVSNKAYITDSKGVTLNPETAAANSDAKNGAFYIASTVTNPTTKNVTRPVSVGGRNVHIATTTGLTESVCRRINYALYGTIAPTAVPTAGGATDNYQNRTTGAITIASNLFPNVSPLDEGCVKATGAEGRYLYFKVLGVTDALF